MERTWETTEITLSQRNDSIPGGAEQMPGWRSAGSITLFIVGVGLILLMGAVTYLAITARHNLAAFPDTSRGATPQSSNVPSVQPDTDVTFTPTDLSTPTPQSSEPTPQVTSQPAPSLNYTLSVRVRTPQVVKQVQVLAGMWSGASNEDGTIPDARVIAEQAVDSSGVAQFLLPGGDYFVNVLLHDSTNMSHGKWASLPQNIHLERDSDITVAVLAPL